MFDALGSLLSCLLRLYKDANQEWSNQSIFTNLNLKKKQVSDINQNSELWNMICDYRLFMSTQQLKILSEVSDMQSDTVSITFRIKQLNSIQYKIYRYCEGKTGGRVPINKCFNDLFGIRIILDDNFSHGDILHFVEQNYPDLKLIDSSKGDYIASHIYLMDSNRYFPWELQIWKKTNEKCNLESHKKYKQGYTAWERDLKNS